MDDSERDVDARTFEALFAAHRDDLMRFAARRVGAQAASDVVAEVFLVAWRRRGEYAADGARLWLFGVAHHVIANARRADRRRIRLLQRVERDAQISDSTVPDVADAATTSLQLRAVLASLPWHEQEVLRLTEWERLGPHEAAEVAGCSRATFRVRLHRARRHFAHLIVESDVDSDISLRIAEPAVSTPDTANSVRKDGQQ